MRVLGIDPGSRITGIGVVGADRDTLSCLQKTHIRTPRDDLSLRLKSIFDGVSEAVQDWQPDAVAVEKVFMAKNANSALVLGHARGAAMCAAVQFGVPVVEYSALQIKQAVVGTGSAGKEQVQHMVRVLLGLTQNPQADSADALACAICHINTSQVSHKLAMNGQLQ